MDWIMHNWIADLYGPQFLSLYAGVIAVTLVISRRALRRRDWTGAAPAPPVPPAPDPYEIAYLRGGESELLRTVIFNLVQKGHLRVSRWGKESRIERADAAVDRHALPPLERRVYNWFVGPHRPHEIFQHNGLAREVQAFCATYEQRLKQEHLLMPEEVRQAAARFWLAGAALIVGLGGYKLFIALSRGRHNVAFLIVIAIVSLIILTKLCRTPRLSARGRDYLARLQMAFERLKSRPVAAHTAAEENATAAAPAFASADPTLLVVGLYGVGALAGTPYHDYHETFRHSSASSSPGGCASSSGSGCGSSGGDGGGSCGGGGCGGGGCGGCGS